MPTWRMYSLSGPALSSANPNFSGCFPFSTVSDNFRQCIWRNYKYTYTVGPVSITDTLEPIIKISWLLSFSNQFYYYHSIVHDTASFGTITACMCRLCRCFFLLSNVLDFWSIGFIVNMYAYTLWSIWGLTLMLQRYSNVRCLLMPLSSVLSVALVKMT